MTYQKITIPWIIGNRNMKTAEEVFTSGLVESDLKPVLGDTRVQWEILFPYRRAYPLYEGQDPG